MMKWLVFAVLLCGCPHPVSDERRAEWRAEEARQSELYYLKTKIELVKRRAELRKVLEEAGPVACKECGK